MRRKEALLIGALNIPFLWLGGTYLLTDSFLKYEHGSKINELASRCSENMPLSRRISAGVCAAANTHSEIIRIENLVKAIKKTPLRRNRNYE
jgi:hypothetical protein|tara:strand:- start:1325 stop:1600 length:276 start_codon:yes stop_codon:yes gene_type:complete